jgi:hypothetical protein
MLTNLLPGIREMRAPLVAGYLWLVACWIVLEPHIPNSRPESAVLVTFYRLADRVSPVGLGVIASVTAYLLGSLSIAFSGNLLRFLFRTSVQPTAARWWSSLTPHSTSAIGQLARHARKRTEALLALSTTTFEQLLDEEREAARVTPVADSLRKKFAQTFPVLRPLLRRKPQKLSSRSPAPPPPEMETELWIQKAVVGELDVVATTRLLGKDPELYSAIDRNRAEVDFRLSVIPPLFAIAAAIASRVDPGKGEIILGSSFILSVALHWDALKHQRNANDLILDALVDGRVKSPTLERMEIKAREAASRIGAMENAATRALGAIRRAIEMAWRIDSRPSAAFEARDAIHDARTRFAPVQSTFSQPAASPGLESLVALDQAVNLTLAPVEGRQHPADWLEQTRGLINNAKAHYELFRDAVSEELHRARIEAVSLRETKIADSSNETQPATIGRVASSAPAVGSGSHLTDGKTIPSINRPAS